MSSIEAVNQLDPFQKQRVRELMVLEDFIDYTKTTFLDEGYLCSSEMRDALLGQPTELAIRLNTSPDELTKKAGIRSALDNIINADSQLLKEYYSRFSLRLNDIYSNKDLRAVLRQVDDLTDLNKTAKAILKDRLVLEDFLSYTRADFVDDKATASAPIKQALLGGDLTSLVALLGYTGDKGDLRKKAGILPALRQEVTANETSNAAYDALMKMLVSKNDKYDLFRVLCELGENEYCLSTTFVPPDVRADGKTYTATVKRPGLPGKGRVALFAGQNEDKKISVVDNSYKSDGNQAAFQIVVPFGTPLGLRDVVIADGDGALALVALEKAFEVKPPLENLAVKPEIIPLDINSTHSIIGSGDIADVKTVELRTADDTLIAAGSDVGGFKRDGFEVKFLVTKDVFDAVKVKLTKKTPPLNPAFDHYPLRVVLKDAAGNLLGETSILLQTANTEAAAEQKAEDKDRYRLPWPLEQLYPNLTIGVGGFVVPGGGEYSVANMAVTANRRRTQTYELQIGLHPLIWGKKPSDQNIAQEGVNDQGAIYPNDLVEFQPYAQYELSGNNIAGDDTIRHRFDGGASFYWYANPYFNPGAAVNYSFQDENYAPPSSYRFYTGKTSQLEGRLQFRSEFQEWVYLNGYFGWAGLWASIDKETFQTATRPGFDFTDKGNYATAGGDVTIRLNDEKHVSQYAPDITFFGYGTGGFRLAPEIVNHDSDEMLRSYDVGGQLRWGDTIFTRLSYKGENDGGWKGNDHAWTVEAGSTRHEVGRVGVRARFFPQENGDNFGMFSLNPYWTLPWLNQIFTVETELFCVDPLKGNYTCAVALRGKADLWRAIERIWGTK